MDKNKLRWKNLNNLQLGKYAEYYFKMKLISYGLDVYTPEVDDHGIDFIVRNDKSNYFEIQVKSARNNNYIFLQKNKFELKKNLFAAIVIFREEEEPHLFLIPSLEWENKNSLFVSRDFEGLKCPPEWGLNISKKNWHILEEYRIEKTIDLLK